MNDRGAEGREETGGEEEGKSWRGRGMEREREAELDTVRDGVKIEERMWGKREIKMWEGKQERSGSMGQWRDK